jgi:PAS domain S-box-containing protein
MKARVLVIDDEESIRFTFERFLLKEGYDVVTASGYDEALAKLAENDFDVIFADIILGDKTGIDLLGEVKKRNLKCPVAMVTGAPNIETASKAVRLGAFDYISKPVDKKTLLHATAMALQHKFVIDEKEKYRSNLEAIFSSVKDAIITVDKEMVVVEMNDAAKVVCGFSRNNALGKAFCDLPKICNGRCTEILEATIKQRKSMDVRQLECPQEERSGQVVNVTTSPLLDSDGTFSGAVMVIRDETRLANLERDLKERRQFQNIIGQNEKMQKIYTLIEDLADVQTTVLITGESGTGKELVAEALHYKGTRCKKPLVKVNCSALTESLLESELFGHVKGAFTGAVRDKIGRFQRANGGTIFLDEIGDISPRMQLRLLRVLQEMEFERVGESTPVKVDVRVVAATNQDIHTKVRLGEFREDLYYRLRVVEIILPPLRERRDDVPLLVNHFREKFNQKFNKEIESMSEEVRKTFMDYEWPGNVRELEHAMEHAFILCRDRSITTDHLPLNLKISIQDETGPSRKGRVDGPQQILEALDKSGWNKSRAARLLGVSRRTLYRKLEEYNIVKNDSTMR